MATILFAEDETVLGNLVTEALERKGYKVAWLTNGHEALTSFKNIIPDLCILDVMMPVMDGYSLAKELRLLNEDIPILFLTARSQTTDVVKGFESGGNDYIKKPFSLDELYVRIAELLKRSAKTTAQIITKDKYDIGSYIFFPAKQILKHEQAVYKLSHKETELLKELVLQKNNLLDRKTALLKLWGADSFFNSRNMDVYIAKLRKYLVHDPLISIVNIRGYGFKLIEQSE